MAKCSEPSCNSPVSCRGLCRSHYGRAARKGLLLGQPLCQGQRVEDKVAHALYILGLYAPHELASTSFRESA